MTEKDAFLSIPIETRDEKPVAPTRFRILKKGENTSTHGTFTFDEESAASVMDHYRKRGIPRLMIDYEHKSLDQNARNDDRKSAGRFTPAVTEQGELWATDVRWTKKAKAEIEDGERSHVSPVLRYRADDGKVMHLRNVGLVNLPALDGQEPLVWASETSEQTTTHDQDGTDGTPEEALAVWSTALVNDLPDSSFLYVEAGGKKDGQGKTVPRTMRHFPYKDAAGKIDLPHLRNAVARIPQANIPAAKKRALQEKARSMLARAQGKEKSMNALLIALGLGEDATETQALTVVKEKDALLSAVMRETGTENAEAALGAIKAGQVAIARCAQLEKQEEERKLAEENAKREAIVAKCREDGQLSGAMEDLAKSWSLAQLAEFQQKAPKVVPTEGDAKKPPPAPSKDGDAVRFDGKKWEELTFVARANLKFDQPEVYAALREDYSNRKSAGLVEKAASR